MHFGHQSGRPRQRLTRRGVLRGSALGAAALATGTGCDIAGPGAQWRPGVDPLGELRAATAGLAESYDATIARHPDLGSRLGPLRDAHRAHLEALDRQLVDPPAPATNQATSAGVPDDPATAVSALLAAEKKAASAAATACLAAPGYRAALLGSIAAARASHVEVLS